MGHGGVSPRGAHPRSGLDFIGKVPMAVIHKYTALQLIILLIIFGVTLVP